MGEATRTRTLSMMTMRSLAKEIDLASAQTARDWCKRRGVPYYRDGKINWVRVVDVEAALQKLPVSNDTNRATVVNDSVISMMRRRGRR